MVYFHVAEVLESEDKETNDEVDYEEDEEDEMEDDNLGEDVDVDEVLDLVNQYFFCSQYCSCAFIHTAAPCMQHQRHPVKFNYSV